MYAEDIERGIKELAQRADLSEEDVRRRIQEKLREMEGLLKPDGALYIVAAELGVGLVPVLERREAWEGGAIAVEKLVPGMRHIRVRGRVVRMYGVIKHKKRDGGEGERVEFKVSDGTGTIDVTIWSKGLVDFVRAGGLKEGDVVEIRGARTSKRRGGPALNLDSQLGTLEVLEGDFPEYPKPSTRVLGVSEVEPELKEVDIRGVVAGLFPPREFVRQDQSRGVVSSVILRDTITSDEIRVVLWGEKAERANDLSMGDRLLVAAGTVKASRDGWIEVHVGKRSKVIVEERSHEEPGPIAPEELEARVFYLFEPRSYGFGEQEIFVRDCVVEAKGELKLCRLWGEASSALDAVELPARVKLVYPYEKVDGSRRVLNVGKLGKCLVLEETAGESPKDIEGIAKRIKYQRAWLDETGEGFREIRGAVVRVDPAARISWRCRGCGGRVKREFGVMKCEKCGDVSEVAGLLALSIHVNDGTGVIRVTFFRETAEKLLGKGLDEILEEIEEKGYEQDTYLLEELAHRILGKEVILRGRISYVEGQGASRMTIDEMEVSDPIREARLLTEEIEQKYLSRFGKTAVESQ